MHMLKNVMREEVEDLMMKAEGLGKKISKAQQGEKKLTAEEVKPLSSKLSKLSTAIEKSQSMQKGLAKTVMQVHNEAGLASLAKRTKNMVDTMEEARLHMKQAQRDEKQVLGKVKNFKKLSSSLHH